ncbi:MAG: hypothetical protein ACYDC0_16255 [Acidimicrobiales bacterium]
MIGAVDSLAPLSPNLDWAQLAPVVGVYIGGAAIAGNPWTPEEVQALDGKVEGFLPIYCPDWTEDALVIAADLRSRVALYGFGHATVWLDIEESDLGIPSLAQTAYRIGAFLAPTIDVGIYCPLHAVPRLPPGPKWAAWWPYGSQVPPATMMPPQLGPTDAWQCTGSSIIDGVAVDGSYLNDAVPITHLTKGIKMPDAPIYDPAAPAFTTTPDVPGEAPGIPPVQDESQDTTFAGDGDKAAIVAVFPFGPGFVVVRQDGAVECNDGAPFYGSFDSLPASEKVGITADFVGACPWNSGYVLVHANYDPATGAGLYKFDLSTKPT